MKKNKLLFPILGLTAITGLVTPIVGCSTGGDTPEPEPVVVDTLDISNEHVLLGFKDTATTEEIQQQFGDTLTIPKDVVSIAENAFYRNEETTIPDSIKNFKFEDEYKCETIGQNAFAYAPFESITIHCQRNEPDGQSHGFRDTYFNLPHGAWGLTTLSNKAFYQNLNLKSVKLCATIKNWGYQALYCGNEDFLTSIETIDCSDWVYSEVESDTAPHEISNAFAIDINQWDGKLILRYPDGYYGPNRMDQKDDFIIKFVGGFQQGFQCADLIFSWDERHNFNRSGGTIEYWGE